MHSAHFIHAQSAINFIKLKENYTHFSKLAWQAIGFMIAVLTAYIGHLCKLWRTVQVTPHAAKIFTLCNAILKQITFSLSSIKINMPYTKYWSQVWKKSSSALKHNHTNVFSAQICSSCTFKNDTVTYVRFDAINPLRIKIKEIYADLTGRKHRGGKRNVFNRTPFQEKSFY